VDLEDQIINGGPYAAGDMIRTWMLPPNLTAAALNVLRDELIELRRLKAVAEERQRFRVGSVALFGGNSVIQLSCNRCDWIVEIDGDEPFALAELNRRADEHAEVCR